MIHPFWLLLSPFVALIAAVYSMRRPHRTGRALAIAIAALAMLVALVGPAFADDNPGDSTRRLRAQALDNADLWAHGKRALYATRAVLREQCAAPAGWMAVYLIDPQRGAAVVKLECRTGPAPLAEDDSDRRMPRSTCHERQVKGC